MATSLKQFNLDSSIEEGAQVNRIETIKVNNTPLTITEKTVDITIPSVPTKLSEFENDSNYITEEDLQDVETITCQTIEANSITVGDEKKNVSLEGHTHNIYDLPEISDAAKTAIDAINGATTIESAHSALVTFLGKFVKPETT